MDTKTSFTRFVDDLNHGYERLHTAKEDAFWAAYMGHSPDAAAARADLVGKEQALKGFLSDPSRLAAAREWYARGDAAQHAGDGGERPTAAELTALHGWVRTFQAHAIESAAARALQDELLSVEGELAKARGAMALGYQHPERGFEAATSVKLSVLISNDPDERVRKAAWEGMRSIERHVLDHGFLELVKKRNEFGRMLGGEDFYDATVKRVEGMSKHEVFALLDELEERTRDAARAAVAELKRRKGDSASQPWNVRYAISGDVSREFDPHFPFASAIERWGRSFAALGIRYRGARLVLDLVDRKGKYENGFMHGPVPAWRDHGKFRKARIQFTANAIPGMVGSGKRATETLFHEGGHAAHFANIDMPSPCFAQEFAPTSVAFAETQSMFLDSLLSDADWQMRYARTKGGAPPAFGLVEKAITHDQPFAAFNLRAMLAVCYGERALYEIPESELTPQRALAALRDAERRMLFLGEGSPRPVLAVPHLLAGESSAYYHGYVLAEMAVEQTRTFFRGRDGHLVDNPRIGPDLAEFYWKDGNAMRFPDYVARLTGQALSAKPLAAKATIGLDRALADARSATERLAAVPSFDSEIDLDASIEIVHGNETIAKGDRFAPVAADFAAWIERSEGAK
jgi:hypothetical protein